MNEFLVTSSNPEGAHEFYYKHIYEDNRDLEVLCERYNFKTRGPYNWKWELFSALLTGDKAKNADMGADLINYEVKSAKDTSSFEYQYHPESWNTKLEEDKRVTHLFISYTPKYADIVVRIVPGEKLSNFFQEWGPELTTFWVNESAEKISNKRFRKNIPYTTVCDKGRVICVINATKLIYTAPGGIASDLLLRPIKKK